MDVAKIDEQPVRVRARRWFVVYIDGGAPGAAALNSALDLVDPDTALVAVAWSPASPTGHSRRLNTQRALRAAQNAAARRGVAIETRLLEADSLGAGLVECASAYGAEIIFWGVRRSNAGTGLDREAEYVLKCASAKVVLVSV